MLKGKKLYSILFLKCPKCHQHPLFIHPNPYRYKGFFDMPKKCPVCEENFERETGFYWGAMMVSHALTTILIVIIHLIIHPFYGFEPIPNIIAILCTLIPLTPITFRIARAVWINFFVDYDPQFTKKLK
jgi:hypothetical protein